MRSAADNSRYMVRFGRRRHAWSKAWAQSVRKRWSSCPARRSQHASHSGGGDGAGYSAERL